MKSIAEDLSDEVARRRTLARECRVRSRMQSSHEWSEAARHDAIADEIEEMCLTIGQNAAH